MATPSRDRRETERALRLYEKEARKYDRQMRFFDRLLFAGGREWVCSQATGEVLEIGVGTGRNLPHYGEDVRPTGVELSPAMLEIARARAREIGREIDLRVGDAQALEFGDQSFDTVVCTLSLCTIPDDRAAVAEVRRVLRPGGLFVLLEHVRSPLLAVRLGQRLLEPLAVRFEADHLLREPLEQLQAEGFVVESLERSKLGIVERVAARKPTVSASAAALPAQKTHQRPLDCCRDRRSLRCSLPRHSKGREAAPAALAPGCRGGRRRSRSRPSRPDPSQPGYLAPRRRRAVRLRPGLDQRTPPEPRLASSARAEAGGTGRFPSPRQDRLLLAHRRRSPARGAASATTC